MERVTFLKPFWAPQEPLKGAPEAPEIWGAKGTPNYFFFFFIAAEGGVS